MLELTTTLNLLFTTTWTYLQLLYFTQPLKFTHTAQIYSQMLI
jgi:hypothetical protein